jgi:hypothetical protein
MNELKKSFGILRAGWQVVRSQPRLLLFPFVHIALVIAQLGAIYYPFAINSGLVELFRHALVDTDYIIGLSPAINVPREIIVLGVVLFLSTSYLMSIASAWVGVATYHAVEEALHGRPVSILASLRAAAKHRTGIMQWASINFAVGLVIGLIRILVDELLEKIPGGAKLSAMIVSKIGLELLTIGWAFATIFMLPQLVLRNEGGLSTVRASWDLFKKTWGTNVVADVSLSGLLTLIYIVAVMAINALIFFIGSSLGFGEGSGLHYAIAPAVLIISLGLLGTLMTNVYRMVLFHFAETGDVVGPFIPELVTHAYRPKNKLDKAFAHFGV